MTCPWRPPHMVQQCHLARVRKLSTSCEQPVWCQFRLGKYVAMNQMLVQWRAINCSLMALADGLVFSISARPAGSRSTKPSTDVHPHYSNDVICRVQYVFRVSFFLFLNFSFRISWALREVSSSVLCTCAALRLTVKSHNPTQPNKPKHLNSSM